MDIEGLLASLNGHRVRCVLIGATAFPAHGYIRSTMDIDVFIEPTLVNARRVIAALGSFGYDVDTLTPELVLAKKTLFRGYVVKTDIHPYVTGLSFDEVWEDRVTGSIGRESTNLAGLDSLIRMKSAVRRPKDREDLRVLRRLRDRKQEKTGKRRTQE